MSNKRHEASGVNHREAWWSVTLPSNWRGHRDQDCTTFRANPPCGVLQISAARKDIEAVTDDDLREFAEERVGPGVALNEVQLATSAGVTAKYERDGLLWQEWWLKSGQLMIYATYNVVATHPVNEEDELLRILNSLVVEED
jgi:hypothetical protein